jgi:aminoglycoside phosphotransferase family enzyme/gluconate kinase
MAMNNTLIDALQHSPELAQNDGATELIETHISWVLLTGDYAYKIKKSVNFGFLDFSTLDKRRFYCEEELRLNSRFAPELYLEVVAITGSADQPEIAGPGPVVEWAVKMPRFDPNRTLDQLVLKKALNRQDFVAIGRQLAEFHRAIFVDQPPAPAMEYGRSAAIWQPVTQNFEQMAQFSLVENDRQQLADIERWSEAVFLQLQPCLSERLQQGFIRECHGDLHLGNMVSLPESGGGYRFVFFDCIEFNPGLRWIDTVSELAFTVMDLAARGLQAESNYLLNSYLQYSGDYAGLELLRFYQCYRAMVRAKVALLNHSDTLEPGEAIHDQDFSRYLQLGLRYTQTLAPFLVITHGISGSGKSTVASALAAHTEAIILRSDVERKRLFDLAPDQVSDKSIYTRQASADTFRRLQQLVNVVVAAGLPCIVDATFLHHSLRQQFQRLAAELAIPFHIVSCQASEAVMSERLLKRAAEGMDASEADVSIMQAQLTDQQPLTADEQQRCLLIDTEQAQDWSQLANKLLV